MIFGFIMIEYNYQSFSVHASNSGNVFKELNDYVCEFYNFEVL